MWIKLAVALYVVCAYVIAEEAPPTLDCKSKGTVCDCSSLNITVFPTDLPSACPTNTTVLDLSKNKIKKLPKLDLCDKYKNLTKIVLDENQVDSVLNGSFESCTALKELSLSQNKLNDASLGIDSFKGTVLEALTLSLNGFKVVPDISGLKKLTVLDITALGGENALDTIVLDGSFTNVPLTTLSMGKIGIRSIPANMFVNVNAALTSLNLDGNRIETIGDDAFKHFTNLTSLSLADNNLDTVRSKMFTGLGKLTTLALDGNQLSSISNDAFKECMQVETVTMTSTRLQDIGTAFANLGKLKTLDLNDNPYMELNKSDSFENTSALTDLYMQGMGTTVSGNLYKLPMAIQNIKNLSTLDVSQSKFTTFDESDLTFFNKLKLLEATGNPYSCTCRNSKFIKWFQSTTGIIPKEDKADYKCATCDTECKSLPSPMTTYDLKHCSSAPTPKPTSEPKDHSAMKYGVGFTFLGLFIGILLTSLIVVYMVKTRRACFRSTPYADLDATA